MDHQMSSRTLCDVLFNNPSIRPETTSLISGSSRISYAELRRNARGVSCALQRENVRRGARVAILLKNCPEFIECFFGIAGAGAIAVPLNTRLQPQEHVRLLQDCEPDVLVTAGGFQASIDAIVANVPSVRCVVVVDQEGGTGTNYSDWRRHAPEPPADPGTTPEDAAAILYTSGTTSSPKGVVLTHKNYVSDIRQVSVEIQPTRQSINLQLSPMYHAAFVHTLVHVACGARTVLAQDFDATATLERIQEEKATYFFAVPTMLYMMLDHPEISKYDLGSLQMISYGAAAITGARLHEANKVFGGNKLIHAYGLTECTSHASVLRPAEHHVAPGSIGRGMRGVQIRVVTSGGTDAAPHEIGEIVVRGDNVMKEYWKRPEETARTLVRGWLHTGDLGKRDELGYVRVVDRKNDMVISGGVNVFPRESEEVLAAHPSVAEVAVFGVQDPLWGESLVAAVVLRPDCWVSTTDLQSYAREHLAGFKLPKEVYVLDELPKTASGKVKKGDLRRIVVERGGRVPRK